ncbi:hypothetical protein AB1282_00480 [Gottfriedia sp. S16(2024)]|uniref:hypothetical protein n=1 Tax=Gottfriedia sp. S16(2024) TaxID=3162883 RepID=UPI003D1F70FC
MKKNMLYSLAGLAVLVTLVFGLSAAASANTLDSASTPGGMSTSAVVDPGTGGR